MTHSPLVFRNSFEAKQWRDSLSHDVSVGFVPTMGALHAGHMALVEKAKQECDTVIASIFVNPKQFGENEDFDKYPRVFGQDYDLLSQANVEMIFMPDAHSIYGDNFFSRVEVTSLTDVLCGKSRPSHFAGVTTIVAILLGILRPTKSYFGEKDAQQLAIIKRMHADLHLSGEIIGVPIIRESDGLAMSSRNRYLSKDERKTAPHLYAQLQAIKTDILQHNIDVFSALDKASQALINLGFDNIDYLEIRDTRNLELIDDITQQNAQEFGKIFIAAQLGNTRLIDNLALSS